MRKTLALTAALLLAVTSATAVVGHNDSGGDMHIMNSGSSASSSTAVGPNGTEWTATVSMKDRHAAEDPVGNIGNVSFLGDNSTRVSFTGEIVAPTPCHVIDHGIKDEGNGVYIMNVTTVKDGLDNRSLCTQVLTGIGYDVSFETDEPFRLEVVHNGKDVEAIEHPDYERFDEEPHSDPGRRIPLIHGLLDLFAGLF